MRIRLILIITLLLLTILPSMAQDDSERVVSGTLDPETSTNVQSIPVDEETGMVKWDEYLALPEGMGAQFGFVQVLFPPDPSALAGSPDILLDGAWYPPIPFSSGQYPSLDPETVTQGWMYIEDSTGLLARRDMTITDSYGETGASTWFFGGGYIFNIEDGWYEGYYTETPYLPDEWTGPGIDYFLRTVWFKGVLEGDTMMRLVELCNGHRIGREREDGGRDRLIIFEIPPNEIDRQNGRGSLLVWLTQGYWRLERTRLHTAYAIEVTEYKNLQTNVQLDNSLFYSEFLPEDVYWNMDEYLLTHRNTFLDLPSDLVYVNPNPDEANTEGDEGTGETESSEDTATETESEAVE